MKPRIILPIVTALAIVLTACGKTDDEKTNTKSKQTSSDSISEAVSSTDSGEPDDSDKKPAQADIGENGAKAVTHVMLIPDDNVDISRKVSFRDMYGVHVLHSGVVGLVGAPVEIEYDDDVNGGTLVFFYDPEKLEGVRPDALMFMWFDETDQNYVELEGEKLYDGKDAIGIKIDKPGTYLLVNRYAWFNVWGADLDDNGLEEGYSPLDDPFNSDPWEAQEDVGDIPELIDLDYIKSSVLENSTDAYFKVSTPEQLASAVYYVNCVAQDLWSNRPYVNIELTADIDLAGYRWSPMGWRAAGVDYDFAGEIYGNGHTIKNMTIAGSPYGGGFIGYARYCLINDLHFEDAVVDGFDSGVIIGEDYNSHLYGCSATGKVYGTNAGALVGLATGTEFDDKCKCKVEVNGEMQKKYMSGSEAGAAKAEANNAPTETIWLGDDGFVHRDEGLETMYSGLQWYIERGGERILSRSADRETVLPGDEIDMLKGGGYTVCLQAFIDGYYIPISNTVEVPYKQ